MKKALIYLEEDLRSSIALRFAADQLKWTKGRIQVIHVAEPDAKTSAGTGWVRRTWERGILEACADEVRRVLKTENVACPPAGEPKVLIGDRDEAVLDEMRRGGYDLYIEGFLNTSDTRDFYDFVGRRRFKETSQPVLIAKNMVPEHNVVILAGESVPAETVTNCVATIYGNARNELDLTLLYYRFSQEHELLFKQRHEAGSYIDRAESLLKDAGWTNAEYLVIQGTPEQASAYLRNYGVVVSSFPVRQSPRTDVLALLSNPLLLCKPADRNKKGDV